MTDKTYTPTDFSRARFAVHPDGRPAARVDDSDTQGWVGRSPRGETLWMSDERMADDGWRPVVPLPDPDDLNEETIQRVALDAIRAYLEGFKATPPTWDQIVGKEKADWIRVVHAVLASLSAPPEPTEEERAAEALDRILDEWRCTSRSSGLTLAEHMASHGVRVTETKEESR